MRWGAFARFVALTIVAAAPACRSRALQHEDAAGTGRVAPPDARSGSADAVDSALVPDGQIVPDGPAVPDGRVDAPADVRADVARDTAGDSRLDAGREVGGEVGCFTELGTYDDCTGCGDSCRAANADGRCTASGCTQVCHAGFGDCDPSKPDCETPLDTAANCGACGNACATAQPLCAGPPGKESCVAACAASTPTVCGTSCADLQSDPRNCGACGTVCDGYQACERGRCTPRYVKTDIMPAPDGTMISYAAIAPDGSYYLGGALTYGFSIDLDPGPGQHRYTGTSPIDVFLVRFTAAGAYDWARAWPADSGSIDTLTVAPDGSVVLAGSFTGTLAGTTQLTTPGNTGAYVLEMSSDGAVVWARAFTVPTDEDGHVVGVGAAVASDGSVYLGGDFRGKIDLDPGAGTDLHRNPNTAWTDVFLVKLNASGDFVWGRALEADASLRRVAVNAFDDVWFGGTFSGTIDLDPSPATHIYTCTTARDGFAIHLNENGDYAHGRVYDWADSDSVSGIYTEDDGTTYISGTFGKDGDESTSFLQKVTTAYQVAWDRQAPSIYAAAAAPGGGLLYFTQYDAAQPGAPTILAGKLDGAGKPVWTLPNARTEAFFGSPVAVSATKMIVGGASYGGPFDIDPGARVEFPGTAGAAIQIYAF